MVDDRELFERWQAGDSRAGNDLFERYFDAVYRFFRSKVSVDAEDLVQQTFLACIGAKDGLRRASSFRAYLFTAARSKLYDYLRRRASNPDVDFGVTSLADLGASPTGLLARCEEHRAALAVLRSLPLDLQLLLELHHIEKMRGPQLAEVLGIPEGTVRSRLRRARELLGERLRERGSAVPAAASDVAGTLDNLEAWAASLGPRTAPIPPS